VINRDRTVLIRGSGVDLQTFRSAPEPPGKPLVVLPSRMLWDKGVGEFVEAVRRLNNGRKIARFVLVGAPDPDNPRSINPIRIQKWVNEGLVEWWGNRRDMPHVYAQSHIVCLPSYREGLPKVLLEAAACRRAIITSHTVGCSEVVKNGINGLLVPSRNATALADAISYLLAHPEIRKRMGCKGREMVESNFSQEKAVDETISLYQSISNQSS
jgi:glycosyltransferase involved in cell wall biosynthesis